MRIAIKGAINPKERAELRKRHVVLMIGGQPHEAFRLGRSAKWSGWSRYMVAGVGTVIYARDTETDTDADADSEDCDPAWMEDWE